MRKYITKATLDDKKNTKPNSSVVKKDDGKIAINDNAQTKTQEKLAEKITGSQTILPVKNDTKINISDKNAATTPQADSAFDNQNQVSAPTLTQTSNGVSTQSKNVIIPKKVQVKSGPQQKTYTQEERDRAVIEVRELIKNFYVGNQEIKVLKGVSVQVNQGDFLVILGPSGCGKSTMLHILLGLELPTAGEVKFLGRNIYDKTNEDDRTQFRKEHVGMIYQQPNWIKSMTVIENVAFPLILRGYQKEMALEIAHEAIDLVHMTQWENQIPTELSGGQQQRVALARCIVHNPEVIVADEPTGNLDYESGIEVMELLQRLNVENKKTMIMVTHDIEYVKYATCAIRVFDGQILGYFTKDNMNELVSQLQTKRMDKSQV